MVNKVLIGIVLMIILGGGAYWYMSISKRSVAPSTSPATSITDTPTTVEQQPMSLRGLLTSGISQQCTFSTGDENTSSNGTVYLSGGKMRGDFSTMLSGKASVSHMIVADNTSYVWIDGQDKGFKMAFDEAAKAQAQQNASSIDPDKSLDYNCSAWIVDQSQFVTPATVEFTDFGKITIPSINPSGASGSSTGGTMDKCSACGSLSGDPKNQCLAALGCSQ